MKRILLIILTNIILFFIIIFSVEVIIWGCENIRIKIHKEQYLGRFPISFHPGVTEFNHIKLDDFKAPVKNWIREPEGLNYKKSPIVIFGCSFAYGLNLTNEQTFSYKLSHLTKRPVYNRAVPGWGIQHMLNQVRQNQFYLDVPEPEYIIFVMIKDHFRRLYVPTFMSSNLLNESYNLRYELEDEKLVIKRDKNTVIELIHRLYIVQKIEHFYINNFLLREENYNKYFSFATEHFIESKKEMERHWNNTKYVIVLYQSFQYDDLFIEKLKENNFMVISLKYDYNLNLFTSQYLYPDYHPKEEAWDLLTAEIAKSLNL